MRWRSKSANYGVQATYHPLKTNFADAQLHTLPHILSMAAFALNSRAEEMTGT